ncbi:MAG: rhomboid family intramembrane serine protease [Bacteroidota bacterium]
MKAQFVKAFIKTMVGDHNFLLLKDRDGNLKIGEVHNILAKEQLGSNIFIELLDGDGLSGPEITARLQHNRTFLAENKQKNGFFFLEIFIFESNPNEDKLASIQAGQYHNLMGKTFLKCLTIDLTTNRVERHFKMPRTDLGLSKTITRLLETGINDLITDDDLVELISQKEQEYKMPIQSKAPIITYSLIGLNVIAAVIIFLYSIKSGIGYNQLLIDFGAKDNSHILSGEYWRFITPIFLHANILHLLINCYSLFAVGDLVEKIFGRFRFLTVYFCAGIMGNIASFVFSSNPGVGASGSIFGLLGALLFFGILKPALFKSHFGHNVILTILINLGYGFTTAGIDNFAHIGGLIGGFLAAGIVAKSEPKHWFTNRYLYFAFATILAFSGLIYGFNNPQNKIALKIAELEKLDQGENWVQAESKAKEILKLNPSDKRTKVYILWTLAKAQAFSGKYSEAIVTAKELTAIDPANGHYLQGLLYYDIRQYALARIELEDAKRTGAKSEMIDKLLKEISRLEK